MTLLQVSPSQWLNIANIETINIDVDGNSKLRLVIITTSGANITVAFGSPYYAAFRALLGNSD